MSFNADSLRHPDVFAQAEIRRLSRERIRREQEDQGRVEVYAGDYRCPGCRYVVSDAAKQQAHPLTLCPRCCEWHFKNFTKVTKRVR